MEWIGGHSIAQTIYSCVYLKDYTRVSSPLLKNFIALLILTMKDTYDIIMDAQIYFEEDFAPDLCGFDLSIHLSPDTLVAQITHVLRQIREILASDATGLLL